MENIYGEGGGVCCLKLCIESYTPSHGTLVLGPYSHAFGKACCLCMQRWTQSSDLLNQKLSLESGAIDVHVLHDCKH